MCVNPLHITPGTPKENAHDMVWQGRNHYLNLTHAKCGHSFTDVIPNGPGRKTRVCKPCRRALINKLTYAREVRIKRLALQVFE